jgi:hypothetical protein
VRAASIYADLVFHLLAFVPVGREAPALVRAASLYSERYQRWARVSLPLEAIEPCERDAAILGAMLSRPDVVTGIQLLAILHDDVDQALGTALSAIGELRDEDVASPWALSVLRRLPVEAVEIARIAVALAGPDFVDAHPKTLGRLTAAALDGCGPLIDACGPSIGALATADIRLSATLGEHGRGYGDTVIVGLHTLPPDDPDPVGPLVLALHELAVQAASKAFEARGIEATWSRSERAALLAAARAASGSPLEAPYVAWRATLSTEGLVGEGEVPPEVVEDAVLRLRGSSA